MVKPNFASTSNGEGNSMDAEEEMSFIVINQNDPLSMPSINPADLALYSGPNSHEEIQKKLRDVLQENTKLKETLEQNNLAMKQQMNTLVKWQEEVAKVSQTHREKFEGTKALMNKLQTENSSLKKKIEIQPTLVAENEELKFKIANMETYIKEKDHYCQDLEKLKVLLEQQVERTQHALNYAEEKVETMCEQNRNLHGDNEEMKCRIVLLQNQIEEFQADGYVVVKTEPTSLQESNPSMVTIPKEIDDIGIKKSFPEAMDYYEEKLIKSLQCLEYYGECLTKINAWILDINTKLPNISSNQQVDMFTIKNLLERIHQHLRTTDITYKDSRSQLAEGQKQLGRLASDYQELHEQWLNLIKTQNDDKNKDTYNTVQIEGLTNQISELSAKLLAKEEQYINNEKKYETIKQSLDEKIKLLDETNEIVKTLKTQVEEKTVEFNDASKAVKTLKEDIETLNAQCEVYKTDFQEERESRETVVAEKDRIATDLRSLQHRNQELLQQLEEYKQKVENVPVPVEQPASSSSGAKSTSSNYHTIATPGRRNQQQNQETGRASPTLYPYECPKCSLGFKTYAPLVQHVDICLDQDMYP